MIYGLIWIHNGLVIDQYGLWLVIQYFDFWIQRWLTNELLSLEMASTFSYKSWLIILNSRHEWD